MTDNLGPGVSRVLDPQKTGYTTVVLQQGKPPLDSEINLLQQISAEWTRLHVLRGTPSGWYGDAVDPSDSFITNPLYSNWFQFGPQSSGERGSVQWAVVNGWLIPVTGTLTGNPPGSPDDVDTWNRIALPPPPANTGDARIDFVFLEVWKARIPPNPATTNKPAAGAVWRYGNVEGGYSFIADDLQDPAIGFETTQRVQLQYRIRVVSGLVGLASFPDGFDPSTVKAQGAAASTTSFIFENMRDELGDPGLWRAGDGTSNALGTVDGYSYAVPLCAVFRRNSVAWNGDPGQNLNGSFNRNPTAVDRTGFKTFSTTPTLAADISPTATSISLASVANIPLPTTPASPVAIQIGDEVMFYTAISGTTMTVSARGALGSQAEQHRAGSVIKVLSGRPDGLFSDQIAKNDILDLRHAVSAGFDYQALLKSNLDKLLRGQLRSTWKRSGGGPQGPFVAYQDKVSASPGALGITKLDAPDGVRSVFGDPVLFQPVVIPISTPGSTTPTASIGGTLGNTYTVSIAHAAGTGFQPGDVITIPKAQFTASLPGSDVDQVEFIGTYTFVGIRFMGETADLPFNQYNLSVNGSGDLLITLTGSFSARNVGAFITLYLLYGAGRGLSRRPDAVHSVAYLSGSPNIMLQAQGVPSDNQPLRATWAPLWSSFQDGMFNGQLASTAEAHVDPGSKTVILTPFRLQNFTQSLPNSTFKTIQKTSSADATNGAMPSNDLGGNPKWGSTDPLGLFSGYTDPTSTRRNMVVIVPRRLMPGWGEVRVPILYADSGSISQGINFGFQAPKGVSPGPAVSNYVPTVNGSISYVAFTTLNLNTDTPVVYNTATSFAGTPLAGMRFFTDSRGLGRQGLELPPFYGIARLFAVYEAQDYKTNGSAFDPSSRQPTGGGATNLLRQNFDGATFWIESDVDGDPTFILNGDAIDISRSPNPITTFASGNYVIEASIFGADRGAFKLTQDCRIVLSRARGEGTTPGTLITNPQFLLPGAPEAGDEIVINYSRTPYQGDAWGSQMTQSDISYKLGPLTTAVRFQLLNTHLNQSALSRPNQKTLEVLAGMRFLTTLGTGRLSGNIPGDADFRNVGYESWFPLPSTSVDPRPNPAVGATISPERTLTIGGEYLGCTERLPLGALFRDKDFRGNYVSGTADMFGVVAGPLVLDASGPGILATSVAPVQNQEYTVAPVHTSSMASGQGGEVVVHVDGNAGNYNDLTNFRTNRGGSAFTASGYSGGDLGAILTPSANAPSSGGILSGIALLVRNVPTNVGSNEVSAGSELMMLIATTARAMGGSGTINAVQVSTSGTGEGYSAVDLYRISGHPLTNDPSRALVDPASIVLARPSDILVPAG